MRFKMAIVQIRLSEELKDKAQKTAEELGMDLSTAIRVFLIQMVKDEGLPFQPMIAARAKNLEEETMSAYAKSVGQFDTLYKKLANS